MCYILLLETKDWLHLNYACGMPVWSMFPAFTCSIFWFLFIMWQSHVLHDNFHILYHHMGAVRSTLLVHSHISAGYAPVFRHCNANQAISLKIWRSLSWYGGIFFWMALHVIILCVSLIYIIFIWLTHIQLCDSPSFLMAPLNSDYSTLLSGINKASMQWLQTCLVICFWYCY